ncbi:MAG: DEAD/DEAH box helicase, partial [Sedimenticola sp.]
MASQAENIAEPLQDPVERLGDQLREKYRNRITGELVIPAREGEYAPFPADLDPKIAAALESRQITQLYTHQSACWHSVKDGRHTVIVTPTASGKTLCYNLPVLQAALQRKAKALYMFPTKALAQDQVAELLELNQAG